MIAAHKQLLEDGLPAAFIMTKAERHALWEANPPRNTSTFLDPRIEQDRQLRKQIEQEATKKRIHALRQSKGLIDDAEQTTNLDQPQENSMAKYTIKPLDQHGHPVMRAITSINDDADEGQIEAKVKAAAERGGSKVANVLLINTLGQVVLAWEVKEGVAGPCDAGPFQPVEQPKDGVYKDLRNEEPQAPTDGEPVDATAPQPAAEEEGQMAKRKSVKKAKSKTASKAKKVKGEARKGSKTEIAVALLKRKSGCTSEEMMKAVKWVVSIPYFEKATGMKIKKVKEKGEKTRYYLV